MARRKKRHEEHQNHEAWAIPYGDLITLLLAFFVVMYAISSVNEGKYRVLSDSLVAAFRGTPRTLEPIQVGEKQSGSGADVKTTLVEQSMLEGQPRSMLTPIPIETGMPETHKAKASPYPDGSAQSLEEVADKVARAMDELVRAELVVVRHNKLWIEVEINTDILFPSGSAELQANAVKIIQALAEVLKPFPNALRVEGHTDNLRIRTREFPSNWELSAARAASVVHLFATTGVDPSRLAIIGLGEYRPAKPNDTPAGRNANRRVIIVILSAESQASNDPAAQRVAGQQDAETATGSAPAAGDATPPLESAPANTPAPVETTAPSQTPAPEPIAQTRGINSAP
jgi:chemotaxis protein MotB